MYLLREFLQQDHGATAIEYGLIAGLISIVIVASTGLIGGNLTTIFTSINTALSGA